MSRSVVYFIPHDRALEGIGLILERSGFFRRLKPKKKLGLKVHFGEAGNSNHLDPRFVQAAAIAASFHNLQPVAIETTALYRGKRQNAASHLALAKEHGFGIENTLTPIEILDGDHGEKYYEVPLDSRQVPVARLAQGLRLYQYLINLAHFKGHFVTGFGGVFKNLSMGLAAKAGKLEMHSHSRPYVDAEQCVSCGICVEYCPVQAINFVQYVAQIGRSCNGCGGCLAVCPQGAIRIKWNAASGTIQAKMAEYARAVLKDREAFHFNFLLKITPNCDCYPQTEKPVTPDIGVLASDDPVACEQAAYERIKDHIDRLYPHLSPEVVIEAAENLGLGTREHLIEEL
jgi:uncharacterized Fe-S center protein